MIIILAVGTSKYFLIQSESTFYSQTFMSPCLMFLYFFSHNCILGLQKLLSYLSLTNYLLHSFCTRCGGGYANKIFIDVFGCSVFRIFYLVEV